MSYASGQQQAAQVPNAGFDEQMMRRAAADSYFLSSSFGSVDREMEFLHYQTNGIRVKEESKGPQIPVANGTTINNVPYYASPVVMQDTGYTTPGHSSISSEGNHVISHGGPSAVFSLSESSSVNRNANLNNSTDSYSQQERDLELQQQQQLRLQQELQQQLNQEQQDLSNQTSDSATGANDSEEQIRRKRALNRAAQKAFRERKEARVKQLEKQLKDSENDREQLLNELEQLRKHNIEMHAENRILLQTKNAAVVAAANSGAVTDSLGTINQTQNSERNKFTFPSKRDFVDELINVDEHNISNDTTPPSLEYSHNGEQVMTVSATWEYLNRMSETFDFDLSLVMCKLKGRVVCHGKGPSYFKSDIDKYIEASRAR